MSNPQLQYLRDIIQNVREILKVQYDYLKNESALTVEYLDRGGNVHCIEVLPNGHFRTVRT